MSPDSEPTPINGEETETITQPVLSIWLNDGGGYDIETVIDNPIALAGIAWYIDQMARRLLATQIAQQQQQQSPPRKGILVPEGYTAYHRKGRN